jgi:putative Holliday junction resolvase
MKYLGIDFGTKKVGIAISDEEGTLAFPREVVRNDPRLLSQVFALVKSEGVGEVVVGESTDFKGVANPVMQYADAFVADLRSEGIVVSLEPEFLTSAQARTTQGKNDMIDASAAALILQSFLDRKNKKSITET